MEQCGYGSWEEVSRLLPGKHRTSQDVKNHFDTVFVNGECKVKAVNESSFSRVNSVNSKPQVQYYPLLGPSDDPPRPGPANLRLGVAVTNCKNSGGGGWLHKLTGYNPARAEFSQEWDNQAESVLNLESSGAALPPSDSVCGEDETELESALKLSLVSMYNTRLRCRHSVKKLVREHSLINKAKVGKWLARLRGKLGGTSWDVEQFNKFSQLLCAVDLDFLMEGFLLEFELRSKVLQLQEVRRAGVRMLGSVELMECLGARRREHLACLGSERVQDWVVAGGLDRRAGVGASKRVTLPLDIVGLPGCEKLNKEERELCSQVRIIPNMFMEIREVLVFECEKSDGIKLAEARSSVKIDVNKTRRIYDFLLQQGTIWAPRSSSK